MLNLCATVERRKISWKFSKSETSVSASFSPSFKREQPQESDWQTTIAEPKFISTTSWHVMGNQTWWDVIAVKSLYTTHFVPMLSWRESDRQRNRRRRLSAGLLGRQGWLVCQHAPSSAGWVNGHLSSGVWGSWGYPQRHSEVKWVTMFEVCPAVIAPNIQQMSGSSAR